MKKIIGLFVLIFFHHLAFGEYIATGPITGPDCYSFGISFCSTKTITEVRKDGQRFAIRTQYDSVSRYSNGKCTINVKSDGLGLLSLGINALSKTEFWGYSSEGKFEKVDPDYLYFSCVKR